MRLAAQWGLSRSTEEAGGDSVLRAKKNSWTVGVAGGQLSGTYMTFANELAEVLDDGENLRVLPIVTCSACKWRRCFMTIPLRCKS